MRSSVCLITPVPRALPVRGHNTNRYYQCLMYTRLCTFDTIHKKIYGIGPGLRIMLEGNFAFWAFSEVCRQK
jgi:hypothetical protein